MQVLNYCDKHRRMCGLPKPRNIGKQNIPMSLNFQNTRKLRNRYEIHENVFGICVIYLHAMTSYI